MNENSSEIENVIIIGGGPAGLAAALYTARAGFSPLLFAGSPPGGQLMLTSEVENYPGFESILGPELIQKYRTHVQKFGVKIIDQNITKVDFSSALHTVNTVEKSYQAKSIIIATGAKALWLGLENETRLRGKGVSACATCDAFFFKNKVVAVVGGGDTAMEEALTLTKFASKVYIIHRHNQFRASKIMQDRVFKNPRVEVIWNTVVTDVLGENRVEGVKIKRIASLIHGSTEKETMKQSNNLPAQAGETILSVDGLFLAIGHKPDTDVFADQIELDEKGYILTTGRLAEDYLLGKRELSVEKLAKFKSDKHYQSSTSVPGVFAAGDCVDYVYRQAGTAVGMGIEAALDVERWLEISSK